LNKLHTSWRGLCGAALLLSLQLLSGCSQTVAIQGHLQVTPAPAAAPAATGTGKPAAGQPLTRFQTGSADVALDVAPDTKVVSALTLKQGEQQQKISFKGLNWGQDDLALQLTEQQLNGSVRLNWQHDSKPQQRQVVESCTFAGWCQLEVVRDIERCKQRNGEQICTLYRERRLVYDYYPACPGVQLVSITEQYSHALLNLYLSDSGGNRLEFSGKSQADLFELDRRISGSCRQP
jgi:hypothetical protein